MNIIDRNYICLEFKYDGKLTVDKGAFPTLQIGFAIQDSNKRISIIDVIHDFKYNNYDATVSYVVNCKTKVDFLLSKPNENEIWEEIKLQSVDFGKLLMQECTTAKKNIFPNMVNIDEMKDKILNLVRNEINELYG